MNLELLWEMAWKSLLCAAIILVALLLLLRGRSAAEKSLVAQLGLVAILLLPVATSLLPDLEFRAPAPVIEAYDRMAPAAAPAQEPATERVTRAVAVPAAEAASTSSDWSDLLWRGWALPAGLLLVLTFTSVARLQRLRGRAEVVVDPAWLTALAAAQRRLGLKHGTALLVSEEVETPISWGVIRPIIILDPGTVAQNTRAEAIIAHELAHVARLDWLALLLGRAVAAIFWFNPLVWRLAREAQDLAEQAADDVVLRSDVAGVDYAEVLVGAARHQVAPLRLAANGVAPSRHSLGRRVLAILDPARSRIPAGLVWTLLTFVMTSGIAGAVAAASPCLGAVPTELELERGRYGRLAAAELAAIPTPQTRALAEAITHQDWAARRVAGWTRFDDRRAVAPLLSALRDESATTRAIAVWGLSELRPPEAIAPLTRLLGDPSPEVRAEAARALGDLNAAGQSGRIAVLLDDPEPAVRMAAAHALGDLRDPATKPMLKAALDDPDPDVRHKVRWALGQVVEEIERREHRSGG